MLSGEQSQVNECTLDLCNSLVEKLVDVQHCLQKWHAAVQKLAGEPAANPLRGQGRILSLLENGNEMKQRELCDSLGIRPQSLGEMLAKLERAGYITRRACAANGHALAVKITPAGLACLESRPNLERFQNFTNEELTQFMGYLDRTMLELNRQRENLATREGNE